MGIKGEVEKRTEELLFFFLGCRWEGASQGIVTEVEDLIGCNLVRVIHESDERAGMLDYRKCPEERWEIGAQHFKYVNLMGKKIL